MASKIVEAKVDESEELACLRETSAHSLQVLSKALEKAVGECEFYKESAERSGDALRKSEANLNKYKENAENRIASLEGSLRKSHENVLALREQLQKFEASKHDGIAALQREIVSLRYNLAAHPAEIKTLEDKIRSLELQIEEINKANGRIRAENISLRDGRSEAYNSLMEECNGVRQQLSDALRSVELAGRANKTLTETLSYSESKIVDMAADMATLSSLEDANQDLAKNIKQKDSQIAELQKFIDGLTADFDALQNRINPKKIIQTRIINLGSG